MSEVIEADFGRSAFLDRGDFVRMVDCDCCHGIVVSVEERYTEGTLAGQAREFTVAVINEENTWDIEPGHCILDIVRVLTNDKTLVEEKPGTVLQFEDHKIRVNGPEL